MCYAELIGKAPLVGEVSFHLSYLFVTQRRPEENDVSDLDGGETAYTISVSGSDHDVVVSCRDWPTIINVVLLVAVCPLSSLEAIFSSRPDMSFPIDFRPAVLPVAPSRSSNRKGSVIVVGFPELPSDAVFASFGNDWTPICDDVSFGHDEEGGLFTEIEGVGVRDAKILVGSIEFGHVLAVPSAGLNGGAIAVRGMMPLARLVPPEVQVAPEGFVGGVAVAVDVGGVQP